MKYWRQDCSVSSYPFKKVIISTVVCTALLLTGKQVNQNQTQYFRQTLITAFLCLTAFTWMFQDDSCAPRHSSVYAASFTSYQMKFHLNPFPLSPYSLPWSYQNDLCFMFSLETDRVISFSLYYEWEAEILVRNNHIQI